MLDEIDNTVNYVDPVTLSCIKCDKVLEDASGGAQHSSGRSINQPMYGMCFHSGGQYGTAFFDPMDGSKLEVNICDTCLKIATGKKQIMYYPSNTTCKLYEGE